MNVRDYAALARSYLQGAISTPEFERRYLAWFKVEPAGMDPRLFQVLNELFCDLDCYSPTCQADQEDSWNISEGTLRRRVGQALAALEELMQLDP